MALSAPTLATPTVTDSAALVTTAAFTPTAGALLVVFAGARATVLMGAPTIDPVTGLTWTQLTDPIDGLYDPGSSTRHRALAWAAVVGGSSIQITTRSTSAARMVMMVQQVTGHGGVPANAKANANANGDPTMTLPSAPAASSVVMAFLSGASTTAGASTPAGFTQLDNNTDAAGISWHCGYDLTSPPTSVAYSSTYNAATGIAVEVSQSSGGGQVLFRPSRKFAHMIIR